MDAPDSHRTEGLPLNDIVRGLGPLALVSRLRRLGDQLYRDITRSYAATDGRLEPRWFPVLHALSDGESRSVTQLGSMIGMTHPAVNQIAQKMADGGLLESRVDGTDQRRRLLSLTDAGLEECKRLEPFWAQLARAVDDLVAEAGGGFFRELESLEREFTRRSLESRMRTVPRARRAS